MKEMDYEVSNEEIEAILKGFGASLNREMPKGFGFSLLIFSYGKDGSMFYISSAQRQDMIKAMREFIDKFEIRQ